MKARAPGKVVLTGAYAVLEGAPAIVASVDRYAFADGSFAEEGATAELRAAFPRGDSPHVDLSGFHGAHGKLGLGGSAAALVAGIVAKRMQPTLRDVFEAARRIHREVQGGGSGIDVAASVFGGVQCFTLASGIDATPTIEPVSLPKGLVVCVYSLAKSARTSDLLGSVRAFKERSVDVYDACMEELVRASSEAAEAVRRGDPRSILDGCIQFSSAFRRLGESSGARLVLPEVSELHALAEGAGGVFYPAGAGGGDLAVYVGQDDPGSAFADRAALLGIERLDVRLGVPGVESVQG